MGTHRNFQLILEKSQVHLNYKSQLGKMAGLLACWVPDWKEHRCLALLLCATQAACEISQNGVLLSLHILHFAISKPYDDMFCATLIIQNCNYCDCIYILAGRVAVEGHPN